MQAYIPARTFHSGNTCALNLVRTNVEQKSLTIIFGNLPFVCIIRVSIAFNSFMLRYDMSLEKIFLPVLKQVYASNNCL